MANILTTSEAATVLRCETSDPNLLALLPLVDTYLKQATGRDWAADASIRNEAKSAARMLLTLWHENPAMISSGMGGLMFGLPAVLMQLKALALELATSGVPDEELALVSSFPAASEDEIAITITAVLIFNHEMASAATSAVTLENAAGNVISTTKTLDVTKKIMTINPTSNLTAASDYSIVITDAADIYGGTITDEIGFTTA